MIKPKTITSKTIQVYDWFEIQNEICQAMNITEHAFRDLKESHNHFNKWADDKGYRKNKKDSDGKDRNSSNIWYQEYMNDPTGDAMRPEYCDLWHVALKTIVPDDMHNDSIVTMYPLDDFEEEKETYTKAYGDWTIPFFEAYNKVMSELDPQNEGIEVEFSW